MKKFVLACQGLEEEELSPPFLHLPHYVPHHQQCPLGS